MKFPLIINCVIPLRLFQCLINLFFIWKFGIWIKFQSNLIKAQRTYISIETRNKMLMSPHIIKITRVRYRDCINPHFKVQGCLNSSINMSCRLGFQFARYCETLKSTYVHLEGCFRRAKFARSHRKSYFPGLFILEAPTLSAHCIHTSKNHRKIIDSCFMQLLISISLIVISLNRYEKVARKNCTYRTQSLHPCRKASHFERENTKNNPLHPISQSGLATGAAITAPILKHCFPFDNPKMELCL